MVAHTGFLTFGRKIEPSTDTRGNELIKEIGATYMAPESEA